MTPRCHVKLDFIELVQVADDIDTKVRLYKRTAGIVPVTMEELKDRHWPRQAGQNMNIRP
jgi:hypothetical protein